MVIEFDLEGLIPLFSAVPQKSYPTAGQASMRVSLAWPVSMYLVGIQRGPGCQ